MTDTSICGCSEYPAVELETDRLLERIAISQQIKQRLHLISSKQKLGLSLFRCPVCGECWQGSFGWYLYNFVEIPEYLYRVPQTSGADWEVQPFVRPDEVLVYVSGMRRYLATQQFVETTEYCRADHCKEHAVRLSVLCKRHHIESVQNMGNLPKPPFGRVFPPYSLDGV